MGRVVQMVTFAARRLGEEKRSEYSGSVARLGAASGAVVQTCPLDAADVVYVPGAPALILLSDRLTIDQWQLLLTTTVGHHLLHGAGQRRAAWRRHDEWPEPWCGLAEEDQAFAAGFLNAHTIVHFVASTFGKATMVAAVLAASILAPLIWDSTNSAKPDLIDQSGWASRLVPPNIELVANDLRSRPQASRLLLTVHDRPWAS